MIIGVLKEPVTETRVSLLPEHVAVLYKKGVELWIEPGIGHDAWFADAAYTDAGAVLKERTTILQQATILLCINALPATDLSLIKPGTMLTGIYQPLYDAGYVQQCADAQLTVFSIDMIPRTTRAQSMDVLSSQASIAGYKAVLLAANLLPRYFPMLMTAAGSIPPAKVLILGAGVAGLQAIATARRLGAVVEVFDTRPAVKEEVMSLGGKFVEVEGAADASKAGGYAVEQTEDFLIRQKARIAESVMRSDVIITTAQIPGKKAPILITAEMIATMRPGSVIIDLAAATGGNTPFTQPDAMVEQHGVRIAGQSKLASTLPADASKLYGKNILNFLQLLLTKEGELQLNFEDDLVKGSCITYNGSIVHDKIKTTVSA
jgi:H+-translocating NAD(P) transhydrogenase subunit alpha